LCTSRCLRSGRHQRQTEVIIERRPPSTGARRRRLKAEDEQKQRAARAVEALNRFAGALHAARSTALVWQKHRGDAAYRFEAKYALQMTFTTIVITVRKFQDIWRHQMKTLLPEESAGSEAAAFILAEAQAHSVRDCANLLIAHFAADTREWPLADDEMKRLITATKWETEEQIADWVGGIIERMLELQQSIRSHHGLEAVRT
jgi:hypothetical protein